MNIIILKSLPSSDLEAIELTMACAAFEQPPTLILINHGVAYANKNTTSVRSDGKSLKKIFSALPMYDCEQVYVCEQSMEQLGLDHSDIHDFCDIKPQVYLKEIVGNATRTIAF